MIGNYSSKIKIVIFQAVWNTNATNEDRCKIVGESRQKTARFNSVNSEIIGWMLTKFVHAVAGILPLNTLKADLRSANPLSNDEAKSKGRSWQCLQRCLRTSSKFNWLP